MKFQLTTDYAIRVLHYLYYHEDEHPTAEEIADRTAISYSYLVRVTTLLKKAGLVCTERGRHGGYRLGRSGEEISLYDAVAAVEGDITLNRCLEGPQYCTNQDPDSCAAYTLFHGLQVEVEDYLKTRTIADLND